MFGSTWLRAVFLVLSPVINKVSKIILTSNIGLNSLKMQCLFRDDHKICLVWSVHVLICSLTVISMIFDHDHGCEDFHRHWQVGMKWSRSTHHYFSRVRGILSSLASCIHTLLFPDDFSTDVMKSVYGVILLWRILSGFILTFAEIVLNRKTANRSTALC